MVIFTVIGVAVVGFLTFILLFGGKVTVTFNNPRNLIEKFRNNT